MQFYDIYFQGTENGAVSFDLLLYFFPTLSKQSYQVG